MGKVYEAITPEIQTWICEQHLFFVATAPSGAEGHINCSPKGLDSFRILGPNSVGYVDLTGSGAETIAHLRENGRIVFMFCAFSGAPKIVRLHGKGEVVLPDAPEWVGLHAQFPEHRGVRSIIRADITRVSDSCGYGIPVYDYREERVALHGWAQTKGESGLAAYRRQNNARSIDGLTAIGFE